MGRGRIWAEGLGLAGLGGLLFAFPTESLQAAREGVSLCLELLVPSLFPFFVLSSLLISTGLAGLCARPLTRWMEPLFGVGGAFSVPALFVLGVQSLRAARVLAGRAWGDGKAAPLYGRAYWLRCGGCAAALCVCMLLEGLAVPALASGLAAALAAG